MTLYEKADNTMKALVYAYDMLGGDWDKAKDLVIETTMKNMTCSKEDKEKFLAKIILNYMLNQEGLKQGA